VTHRASGDNSRGEPSGAGGAAARGPTDGDGTTEPAEPAESTEPAEPAGPSGPTGPTEPAESTEPTEPAESTGPTEPTEPTEPTAHDERRPSFGAELRDSLSTRVVALVIAVLVLQLGFIASYLGAFHNPRPHDIPLAVVAPSGAPPGVAGQAVAGLNRLPAHPLKARTAPTAAAGRALLDNRTVYGVLLLGPAKTDTLQIATAAGASISAAVTKVITQADRAQGRIVIVDDVIPAGPGDANGLSAFYLVVGWMVGGYLVSAILAIAKGSRPVNLRRALFRLAALALYAIVSGLGGAIIAETILSALRGHFFALWGFGALVVFAVGAFTMALQVLFDLVGLGIAILLFVVLGNPSAGGPYPSYLLPTFWAAIGRWLPPGAGTDAVRTIVYFPAASLAHSLAVLGAYALVGIAVTMLAAAIRPARPSGQTADHPSSPVGVAR
jgi:hypothetical protein